MRGGWNARLRRFRKWKPLLRLRYALEYAALLLVAGTIPRMPRRLVLWCARGVGAVAIRIDRRGRELGLENLRLAIEQGGLDLRGRTPEDVLRACYQNFARGFLDLFWFSRLTVEQLDRWVEIEDSEHVPLIFQNDRGAVFLTPHYGIFEWASLMVGLRGVKLNIVAQDFKNPALTQIVRRARECTGHQVLSRDGAMLKLLRSVKRGGNIALLPDLTVPPQTAAVVVNVFGTPTCRTAAHVEIARRCNALMFVTVCEPLDDGRARLRVLDVIEAGGQASQAALTQAVWNRFEAAIRQRPELWLWMYRHWRYRPLRERSAAAADEPESVPISQYPRYAAEAAAFDELYRKQAA